MRIIREQIDEKTIRITTVDERWYGIEQKDKLYVYLPSVTWIASMYPKSKAFYRWLMEKGWEAEEIKIAAGDRGSKVHQACEELEKTGSVPVDAQFINPTSNQPEELTIEEVDCIISFRDWLNEAKPELLASEMTVFGYDYEDDVSVGYGYAGTLDRIYRIDGQVWIVDLKTSKEIWEEHKLQISAYSHAEIDFKSLGITEEEWQNCKLAILQLGFKKNKKGYKFTLIEDKFNLFLMARAIWQNEHGDEKPKQRDYPLVIELQKPKTYLKGTNVSGGGELYG